jgi:oxysterol-binding protein-related protein 8
MYARGILFGKMKYELGDHSYVRCPELGLSADIEFKTKGWVSGTYNAIGGTIKNDRTSEALYELSGMWTGEMFIKDIKVYSDGSQCANSCGRLYRIVILHYANPLL